MNIVLSNVTIFNKTILIMKHKVQGKNVTFKLEYNLEGAPLSESWSFYSATAAN